MAAVFVMTNENTYIEYIEELVSKEGDIALNPKWVIKVLQEIRHANAVGLTINPDYLRAEKQVWLTGQPMPFKDWVYRKDETCAGDHVGSGLW